MQQSLASVKRVDVTLSSDSEDERPGMKAAAAAAGAGSGDVDGKNADASGRQQPAHLPVNTQ